MYFISWEEGHVRGAPSDFVKFKGRHLLISMHLKDDIFWNQLIWGELFPAEGFLNGDIVPFSLANLKTLKNEKKKK